MSEEIKVLRRPAVEGKVKLCRSTIYGLIKDGKFPAPIRLGPRSVGWVAAELDTWLEERVKERDTEVANA